MPAGEGITRHLQDGSVILAATNPSTGVTILGTSNTDVVAAIIDGYDATDTQEAFLQRLDFAVKTAAFQQGILAVISQEEGTLDIATAGEDTLTAFFADRSEPAKVTEWTSPVPLVHVATHYERYGELPRPTGENVHLLDPYTEVTLLLSLQEMGALEVSFRDEDYGAFRPIASISSIRAAPLPVYWYRQGAPHMVVGAVVHLPRDGAAMRVGTVPGLPRLPRSTGTGRALSAWRTSPPATASPGIRHALPPLHRT
ncbi:hypothetical protein [Curtobacterium sp. ISL-83]|uniref:hypothetical protein n=1 Tax=Curtobacterium sp. ISL-83 TaxID=2819145 RepID=UPI001BEB39BB|nr:hypothetical protein [Curtobacterium sp. ISL-83]MBT2504290.1 hypothetical protein [Curtobacterium sp. ISL-83]